MNTQRQLLDQMPILGRTFMGDEKLRFSTYNVYYDKSSIPKSRQYVPMSLHRNFGNPHRNTGNASPKYLGQLSDLRRLHVAPLRMRAQRAQHEKLGTERIGRESNDPGCSHKASSRH